MRDRNREESHRTGKEMAGSGRNTGKAKLVNNLQSKGQRGGAKQGAETGIKGVWAVGSLVFRHQGMVVLQYLQTKNYKTSLFD